MKVHPVSMKRNIAILYNIDSQASGSSSEEAFMDGGAHKKLRRLPHIFSRVLELPFPSDADVTVEETPDCLRFIAETHEAFEDDVRAYAVEIHPGVTKIVVRGGGENEVELLLDDLEVDTWRFRLPASTRPELASAVFVDGELMVTVPKGVSKFQVGEEAWAGVGRIVIVQ